MSVSISKGLKAGSSAEKWALNKCLLKCAGTKAEATQVTTEGWLDTQDVVRHMGHAEGANKPRMEWYSAFRGKDILTL